jgi:hypothetical protein
VGGGIATAPGSFSGADDISGRAAEVEVDISLIGCCNDVCARSGLVCSALDADPSLLARAPGNYIVSRSDAVMSSLVYDDDM